MEQSVGQYLALHFKDVASAVEYCHQLVAHIIPRLGGAALDQASSAVVWFHVPPYGTKMLRGGCYLFMSPGALRAAQLAQLETPVSGVVPHSSLPGTSVLVFGEDNLEPAAAASAPSGTSVALPRFGAPFGAAARDVDYA